MNIDRLCKKWNYFHEDDIDRVFDHWEKTNSPMFNHWTRFAGAMGLDHYDIPPERCSKPGTTFTNGILNEERKSLCKSIYANEVVKLTIQITDPSVMVIEKDVSATFTDMLGIVGKFAGEKVLVIFILSTFLFFKQRWDNRSFHWPKPYQHSGDCILVVKGRLFNSKKVIVIKFGIKGKYPFFPGHSALNWLPSQ